MGCQRFSISRRDGYASQHYSLQWLAISVDTDLILGIALQIAVERPFSLLVPACPPTGCGQTAARSQVTTPPISGSVITPGGPVRKDCFKLDSGSQFVDHPMTAPRRWPSPRTIYLIWMKNLVLSRGISSSPLQNRDSLSSGLALADLESDFPLPARTMRRSYLAVQTGI